MQQQNTGDLQSIELIYKNDFEEDFKSELISTDRQKYFSASKDRKPELHDSAQRSYSETYENNSVEPNDSQEAKDSELLDNSSNNKSSVLPTPIKLPAKSAFVSFLRIGEVDDKEGQDVEAGYGESSFNTSTAQVPRKRNRGCSYLKWWTFQIINCIWEFVFSLLQIISILVCCPCWTVFICSYYLKLNGSKPRAESEEFDSKNEVL